MRQKNFLRLTRLLQIFFTIAAVFCLFGVAFFLLLFFSNADASFEFQPHLIILFNYAISAATAARPQLEETFGLIFGLLSLLIGSFTYFKVSRFFAELTTGESPFSLEKVNELRNIGFLFCILGVLPGLGYYPLLFLAKAGGSFIFGFTYELIVGLILLVVAETFRYGVSLQAFNDEVV
ncbi:DUF2975 domain-containing protein [Enterococcus nangangensis]|uniref:DUF2975 domain-containing protein n=1 Tax=Enterococcus nangangensis TaxID=2559926 RepID=UPI00148584E9|nr:DUF2975 domain-containing protein [Enterococcus nangangensis]